MSFNRVKPTGWSLNEKLTSAQQNQLDIDHANAIDKTGDTIASGNTIAFGNGSILELQSGSSVNWLSGSVITLTSTSLTAIGSVFNYSAGQINVSGNSNLSVIASQLNFVTSGGAHFQTGTSCLMDAGSILTNAGLSLINGNLTQGAASTWALNGPITASNITISGTNRLKVTSRQLNRTFGHGITAFNVSNVPYWNIDTGRFKQNTVTGTCEIDFELDLPHNSVLDGIEIFYAPQSGHVALPASMPIATLYKMQVTNTAITSIVTASDTSGSLGIYEALHDLLLLTGGLTIDRVNYRYILRFYGETSTNSLTGMYVYGGRVIETITEYDEG